MLPPRSEIISSHPIGDRLEAFRDLYGICQPLFDPGTSISTDGDVKDNANNGVLDFLVALPTLPACRILLSARGSSALYTDILRIAANFEVRPLLPLLKAVRDKEPDEVIWDKVYAAVTESTPPPRPPPSFQQTPWLRNTSSLANSSERRKHVDGVLKEELGDMYVDIPGFHDAFFEDILELQTKAQAVFERCKEGEDPLYREGTGWRGWPEGAKEAPVLAWMSEVIDKVIQFFEERTPDETVRRRPLAQPHKPLQGSTAGRKLDIGFMDGADPLEDGKYAWLQILVPGELKNDPGCETQSRLDLGRYAREVLAAQDSRRFVPGFTLCGPRMRLWHFDRLGGVASEQFDINEEGLKFTSAILGYLLMNEEQLGFDPTVITTDGARYIRIEQDGREERLIIDEVVRRSACVSGRGTTCWKTHRDGDESRTPLVVKESWQHPERDEEGELLREATEKGVVNVARYYYHETIQVGGKDDDIRDGVRRGLDITTASNYNPTGSRPPLSRSGSRKEKSSRAASRKRSSTCVEPSLPPNKRTQSHPPSPPNRVHRRVVVQDYGKPIYKASSRVSLLAALEGCIEGYESLHRAGILQSDISPNNLMVNEDVDCPSRKAFIIDLDLAIKEDREGASGARGKTGTRAFMAIGVLLGNQQHSFMHDLESFFWVLFWLCVHYDGPDKPKVIDEYEEWNYMSTRQLLKMKLGTVANETIFMQIASDSFTSYYQSLIPHVNRLRREVFPAGNPWEKEDKGLYSRMRKVLQEAQADPEMPFEAPGWCLPRQVGLNGRLSRIKCGKFGEMFFEGSASDLVGLFARPVVITREVENANDGSENQNQPLTTQEKVIPQKRRRRASSFCVLSHSQAPPLQNITQPRFFQLPVEIRPITFESLDFTDIFLLGLTCQSLWATVKQIIRRHSGAYLGAWAGTPIICVGDGCERGENVYPQRLLSRGY
ncbi:hypothetical protein EMCG_02152 [[Emmonsia] crescens]|uniref:Fungal-type protein kinase domain-containing protein n=1 Tax=[Emmonsia] crescens TaxID=73230 RepID=A0A0G2HYY4_9EURO|nr:hypothetical protein EMCG_02152 [Emmonsia crescens UAMH 3008]